MWFTPPASAAVVSATDTNPDPNIFEAWLTADERDVTIAGTTVHAMVYEDDPPPPFVSAGAGIPAPQIKVKVGDTVIVHFRNQLATQSASIHWHGIELDNDSDGTAVTQDAVLPGQSYVYRFKTFRPGVYWYHSHMLPGTATFRGMYGPILIENPIEPSLRGTVLPSAANTHTMVLSDIEFDAGGNVGKPLSSVLTDINEIVEICHLWTEGEPGGVMLACGAPTSGKTVLVNGVNPNAGTQTPTFTVASGQRVRLQIVNAAITRHFRLKMLGGGDSKLYRIGGEGGLLDNVVVEGGVIQGWDSLYDVGELVLGSGDRADVIVVPSGSQGSVVQLVGNDPPAPFKVGQGLGANYPIAYFVIDGTSNDVPPAAGDPILANTPENVENLKDDNAIAPLQAPPPFAGSADPTIRLTNQRPGGANQSPSIDGFSAMLDTNVGNGNFLDMPRPMTSRYARLGDTLELSVRNDTSAVHPFHLHGFSMQPVRYVDNASGNTLREWEYDEFLDEIDVYAGQTLVFRVRLDDRPKICDGSSLSPGPVLAPCSDADSGGAVGRWLFHCHIFHHAGLGMMGEIVLLADTTPDPFGFTSLNGVLRSTPQLSNVVTIKGINTPAPIAVSGGQYAVNGGSFGSAAGSVANGATVQLRHTSSPAFSSTITTTLTVGGVSADFSSTTEIEDLVPDPFKFNDRALVLPGIWYESNTVTISGVNSTPAISISGGGTPQYSVNGGAFRSTASTVKNGDTVRLRNRLPLLDLWGRPASVAATLNVGGVTDSWRISLLPPP
ncbi:MAG: multicopper oxidase type 3 [Panacagrimonas sp.]|jgi:FtsP/CotA-like multicopper oxidase with cupredoxin domain|nr:multicopper oxidase family protein [Panacagrimonas sp.]MCC2655707.1 multicopper oxidase type 3 [Panacagrimonas sp.]